MPGKQKVAGSRRRLLNAHYMKEFLFLWDDYDQTLMKSVVSQSYKGFEISNLSGLGNYAIVWPIRSMSHPGNLYGPLNVISDLYVPFYSVRFGFRHTF